MPPLFKLQPLNQPLLHAQHFDELVRSASINRKLWTSILPSLQVCALPAAWAGVASSIPLIAVIECILSFHHVQESFTDSECFDAQAVSTFLLPCGGPTHLLNEHQHEWHACGIFQTKSYADLEEGCRGSWGAGASCEGRCYARRLLLSWELHNGHKLQKLCHVCLSLSHCANFKMLCSKSICMLK